MRTAGPGTSFDSAGSCSSAEHWTELARPWAPSGADPIGVRLPRGPGAGRPRPPVGQRRPTPGGGPPGPPGGRGARRRWARGGGITPTGRAEVMAGQAAWPKPQPHRRAAIPDSMGSGWSGPRVGLRLTRITGGTQLTCCAQSMSSGRADTPAPRRRLGEPWKSLARRVRACQLRR